jgi:hypothetical protein
VDDVWIGYNDIQAGGVFVWTSGSASSYTRWNLATGQPDNNGDQDCAELHTDNSVGQNFIYTWNDAECDDRNHWICERFGF